jgi:riboflavin synthase
MKETLFATYQSKSRVNIETDMFARYIYNLMANKNGLTWDDVDQAHFMY